MTLFRLWVSKDGYYISEAEARPVLGRDGHCVIRPIPPPRLSIFATEEDLSAPGHYDRRCFQPRQFVAPDGHVAETLKIAIAAGASLLIGAARLQPCRYGEMDDYAWERVELLGESP